ncbi:MAG: efflux RND transporter periplasmic adaptor subunit, partial [Acidobacteria bacterium]|nr:efflux RND transporter periplasmic adaptor subunit [Acidobacteriota bacterium]
VDERTYAEVGVPVPARAVRLLAAPGDVVREGQVLVELQSPDLGEWRAAHASAEARVGLADRALARKRSLRRNASCRFAKCRRQRPLAAEARAGVRAAAAELTPLGVVPGQGAEGDSGTFSLRSPVAGTVIERGITRGQMVDPATPAFRSPISRPSGWRRIAFERDAVRIAKGAKRVSRSRRYRAGSFVHGVTHWRRGLQGVTYRPHSHCGDESDRCLTAWHVSLGCSAGGHRDAAGRDRSRRRRATRQGRVVRVLAERREHI